MRWMLDTDICIALIKRQPPELSGRIQAKPWGRVRISSVAVAELEFGIAKSEQCVENSERLRQFLLPFDVDAFDREAASVYGAVRVGLERRGIPIGPVDLFIAAHAMSTDATLVTHNTKEFERIAGLRVEDWIAPG